MSTPTAYIVLDTETTGLSFRDRIIELAAVKVRDGVIVDKRAQLLDPQMPIPPYITGLTGITPEMVRGRSTAAQVLPRFLTWTEGLPIIGHNVSFDLGMLQREGARVRVPVSLTVAADTLTMARARLPELSSHRLGVLVDYLKIEAQPAHRALADVYATQELYVRLLSMPVRTGQARKETGREIHS